MKLPVGVSKPRLISVGDGSYTIRIDTDGSIEAKKTQDWLMRNGKQLLEEQLGYEIEEVLK